ncbi:hypothetical protein K469DRAFT_706206 [Zopfia rhizophila CBS 207.26]|uniref:LPXTG cell wall anchor domain-containing protein n=1 Tax=Zopfia rhizophila CBS 207.26 TaxID=1314779 RepID=A0A6A6ERB5_9PEZI|nr:hypothetical protein K469DRAFT_706206 [Zopfia rhizophila CBS 207.26]
MGKKSYNSSSHRGLKGSEIGGIAAIVVVIVLVLLLIYIRRRKQKQKKVVPEITA